MAETSISLDEAIDLTRTGDVWVFRGRSVPDRAIQFTTNSPVNHVGMSVVLDDLPPLMWHAELGRSLPDMWSGSRQRGVQLHDLRDAVCVWANRYGQRAWLRQLEPPAGRGMEDAVLRTIARLDGTPFPSTAQLAWRWLHGRVPGLRLPVGRSRRGRSGPAMVAPPGPPAEAWAEPPTGTPSDSALETAYCAEVVAVTYEAMGLLPAGRRPNWYDPGRFWSGDDLALSGGARLGAEITVRIPSR
ncbi:hypothetical protein [Plantactinospora sp. GCM10030261]|uniref:hypothetical protein n=1 Tax=Plantactinospora sp. GCM10030261 TaxID=3273420 RepID=UPI00361B763C